LVANTMEAPNPCKNLPTIKRVPETEKPQISVAKVKIRIPVRNNFLRPTLSATLLKGTGKIAETRRKMETTQLRVMAFIEYSFAIIGNARFRAELINGTRIVVRQITKRTEYRLVV